MVKIKGTELSAITEGDFQWESNSLTNTIPKPDQSRTPQHHNSTTPHKNRPKPHPLSS